MDQLFDKEKRSMTRKGKIGGSGSTSWIPSNTCREHLAWEARSRGAAGTPALRFPT
jgi:hypothetical protein